jgi:hypothetical protein
MSLSKPLSSSLSKRDLQYPVSLELPEKVVAGSYF